MTPEEQAIFDVGLKERQERARARWDKEKLQEKQDKLDKIKSIKESIMLIIHEPIDFESIVDGAQNVMINGGVRLSHGDFIAISDAYFMANKHPRGLIEATQLYRELDHANNMMLDQNI